MSDQLGLPGLVVPEEYGGTGASLVEAALVMEELGRSLTPSPYFATTAFGVVPILEFATGHQKQQLLPEIAAGSRRVTTALTEPGRSWGADGVAMRGVAAGDGVTLSGTKTYVVDGHTADSVIVVALAPDDATKFGLYLVAGDAPGLTRTKVETLDLTRPMATLEFAGTPAVPLGEPVPWPRISSVLDVAAVLLAAEMVGGMEAALTMSVEYAKVRKQFNRPIGSFQAIKHRAAEMALELDTSRAAVRYASLMAAERDDELALAAPIAKATAAAGFGFTASWNIQIHGGIGFTWEHDAHLYYRRAKSTSLLFGTPTEHWDAVAEQLLSR
jgi:alkylation response protein AidB-like acyl-CoA dehydrogenase